MRKKAIIYQSRKHLAITLGVVVLPFLFLLLFSRFAHIATGKLFLDIAVSCARLAVAYAIAALLGWGLAVLFYKGKRAIVALPLFDVLQSFPTFALLPLAAFVWGVSNITVIFFLIITIIWPIIFSIISSLKLIKHDWEEAVTVAQLSGKNYLTYFLFPVSIPGLVIGSVIGLGEGWEALVATEIIMNIDPGLGNFFQAFSRNAPVTVFGIFGLLLLIFAVNKLVWLPLMEWSHHQMEE